MTGTTRPRSPATTPDNGSQTVVGNLHILAVHHRVDGAANRLAEECPRMLAANRLADGAGHHPADGGHPTKIGTIGTDDGR